MFTGIIKSVGTITEVIKKNELLEITITSNLESNHLNIGDSVSVEGICSTIVSHKNKELTFQYMPETISKTSVSSWEKGTKVNLEPSLSMEDAVSGHFVSGHIDATGTIKSIKTSESTKEIEIAYPKELRKFIALKGSVSIDGISLTVSMLEPSTFSVSLIPHTTEHTTLGAKKEGDLVNIEIDMLSRYLKQLFDARDEETSYEYLKERGFI
ncbi:riboflavin synthase [bacterium]|nr:riboflavin synthase [bacterium]